MNAPKEKKTSDRRQDTRGDVRPSKLWGCAPVPSLSSETGPDAQRLHRQPRPSCLGVLLSPAERLLTMGFHWKPIGVTQAKVLGQADVHIYIVFFNFLEFNFFMALLTTRCFIPHNSQPNLVLC